ncbi:hypothetical protein MC885_012426 [Smutsia gigantea]|nr:hypothetical protein MC885_012426 [Smutsia gigantea]
MVAAREPTEGLSASVAASSPCSRAADLSSHCPPPTGSCGCGCCPEPPALPSSLTAAPHCSADKGEPGPRAVQAPFRTPQAGGPPTPGPGLRREPLAMTLHGEGAGAEPPGQPSCCAAA